MSPVTESQKTQSLQNIPSPAEPIAKAGAAETTPVPITNSGNVPQDQPKCPAEIVPPAIGATAPAFIDNTVQWPEDRVSRAAAPDKNLKPFPGRTVNVNSRKILKFHALGPKGSQLTPEIGYEIRKEGGREKVEAQWFSDMRELKSELKADMSASASYGVVEGSGGISYNTNNASVGLTKSFAMSAFIETGEVVLDLTSKEQLGENLQKALATPGTFFEKYGNGYISQAYMGAKIVGTCTFKFDSTASLSQFNAHISAGGTGGILSASVQSSIGQSEELKQSKCAISMNINQIGGVRGNVTEQIVTIMEKPMGEFKAGSLEESLVTFNNCQKAIVTAISKMHNGLTFDNSAVLTYETTEFPLEFFQGSSALLSSKVVDKINNYETTVMGELNLVTGLIETLRYNDGKQTRNFMPSFNDVSDLGDAKKLSALLDIFHGDILTCLAQTTDEEALAALSTLQEELISGGKDKRYIINDTIPLGATNGYFNYIRTDCWINCIGANEKLAFRNGAKGLLTQNGSYSASMLGYNNGNWMSKPLDESQRLMRSSNGAWIGCGHDNPFTRFTAPWSFSDGDNKKITPLYLGCTSTTLETGEISLRNSGYGAETRVTEGIYTELNPKTRIYLAANMFATCILDPQRGFITRDNNGTEWNPWNAGWLAQVRKVVVQKGHVWLYTHDNRDMYPQYRVTAFGHEPMDLAPGQMMDPSKQGIHMLGDASVYLDIWCQGSNEFSEVVQYAGDKDWRVFTGPGATEAQEQYFIKLSKIWDSQGRLNSLVL